MLTKGNKRSSSVSVSPQKSRSKSATEDGPSANLKPPTKKQNKKFSYKFAPVNNLSTLEAACSPSSPSSGRASAAGRAAEQQLRNAENDKENKTWLSGVKDRHSEESGSAKRDCHLGPASQYNGDGPSEEVIWMFSPGKQQRDPTPAEQVLPITIPDYSSGTDDVGPLNNQSSTPIMSSRFKTILSLPHFYSNDAHARANMSRRHIRTGTRSATATPNFESKASTRDIDDIINDIAGDYVVHQTQLPSSPMKVGDIQGESREPSANTSEDNVRDDPLQDNGRNTTPALHDITSSADDDDSLIDILTQNFSKPKTKQVIELQSVPEKHNTERSSSTGPFLSLASGLDSSSQLDPSDETSKAELLGSDANDDSLISYLEKKHVKGQPEVAVVPEPSKEPVGVQNDAMKDTANNTETEDLNRWQRLAMCGYKRKGLARLVVLSVKEFNILSNPRQKILTCLDSDGVKSTVIVRKPWVQMEFAPGDVIHIIEGKHSSNTRLLSDDKDPITGLINDNLLVQHPDLLLSATMIGNSIDCMRRAVLGAKIIEPGEPSIHITIGCIVHELLQEFLRYRLNHDSIDDDFIESALTEVIEKYKLSILMCNETADSVREIIEQFHLPNIRSFVADYVKESNSGCKVNVAGHSQKELLSISKAVDIEENIWSHMYGVKGFIDATVETSVGSSKRLLAPLEIKTGKYKHISHEAQGSIYTLLLSDRYDIPVDFHLMYYSKTNDFVKHPTSMVSLKHLLVLRNQLASKLKHNIAEIESRESLANLELHLPPLLKSSTCDTCHAKTHCMVINKLTENGSIEDSGLAGSEYDDLTGHLSKNLARYREFYQKYIGLLHLEESSLNSNSKEMFLMDSELREATSGRCISGLVIQEVSMVGDLYHYKFRRSSTSDVNVPMINSQLAVNESIYISDELGHFSLATGHVKDISDSYIVISCSRRFNLDNIRASGFSEDQQQVIESVLTETSLQHTNVTERLTYRVDKYEHAVGLSMSRFNILNLFLPEIDPDKEYVNANGDRIRLNKWHGGDGKTRRLLVEGQPPRFSKRPQFTYTPDETKFNKDQLKAIDKAIRCKDYALILGMPGTGKTTLIAEIIRILARNGKNVLLTSYTHSAVDNILLKLLDSELQIARLGYKHRVHPGVRHLVQSLEDVQTHEELVSSVDEFQVIATTCLGVNDSLLALRTKNFDYVILDEASQVSLPIALGPIRYGDRFLLVGDHYQLPPLVRNHIAKEDGLEDTLFQLLCDQHPSCMTELTLQYRMNEDIMALSNELIYDGKLKCGDRSVAERALRIEVPKSITQPWLREALNPCKRVIMINYDNIPSIRETADRDNIRNEGESRIVGLLVSGLLSCGASSADIGVMTLYRAQLRLLKSELAPHSSTLEVLTADQFQGRDKECVIISTVRCNPSLNAGALLRELRRVNVAMSRAKSKLILVCSLATISSVPQLQGFLRLLHRNGWVYTLSPSTYP
ncbi:AEL218Wp [Eremothecium gossypii ATCC 10895]|uniref:DNA replication ATP-dependent helicase/nuclease DNA2 n=1 Tax=Eremothecium gossypii (strain ATCC 10895 / CBS 109.51 / FGSC 9923 / NRRL Y-1056) TaxID=284811 RepID=Q758I0_EREGS|nr:AEL218Wp [Eremothecium gossypii ATCC 10895]AAS52467.1 AEL218Wp [Eremothecium gossypii ATCC 10895]